MILLMRNWLKLKKNKIFLVPLIVMFSGYSLLVVVDCIPNEWIQTAAEESAEILLYQGEKYGGVLEGWYIDNVTDADCISVVVNKCSKNPFYNAINAYQFASESDMQTNGIEVLYSSVHGNGTIVGDHSYLWNGFQIWLRPLMIRYNITEIRMLLYLIIIFLSTITFILIDKIAGNFWGFIPFFVSFILFNFQMESLSLLFFNDLFITLIGCIAVLLISKDDNRNKKSIYVFAAIGSSVAFFSMLILPLITLAFPLILSYAYPYETRNGRRIVCLLKEIVSWTVSYGITMVSKIIISIFVLGNWEGILKVIKYSGEDSYELKDRLFGMIDVFIRIAWESEAKIYITAGILVFLCVYVIMRKKYLSFNLMNYAGYIIISLLPCAWCFVCIGHTFHFWTHWLYSITIFSMLQLFWDICGFDRNQIGLRAENN